MRSDRIGLFCVRASVAAAGILWFAAEAPAQFPTTGPGRGGSGGGSYSADGDVWVRVVRNSTGGRTVTTHNANTRIQEVVTYNHLNRVVLKRTYQLNRYDQPERFLVYDARDAVVYRGEFDYDLQDRLSEERLFSMPGDHLVRRLVYDPRDPNGKPKSQIYGAGVAPEILEQMTAGADGIMPPGSEPAAAPKKKKPGLFKKLFGGGK